MARRAGTFLHRVGQTRCDADRGGWTDCGSLGDRFKLEIGLHTVNPDIHLDFRVLGNLYDAGKAGELAADLYADGVDVILTIAGAANQGVVAAAKENGAYVLWFDSDGSGIAPGTVLASAVIRQKKAAEEWIGIWIDGNLTIGESHRVGITEGYVDFPLDGKLFRKHVPESIRDEMEDTVSRMKSGALSLRSLDSQTKREE